MQKHPMAFLLVVLSKRTSFHGAIYNYSYTLHATVEIPKWVNSPAEVQ